VVLVWYGLFEGFWGLKLFGFSGNLVAFGHGGGKDSELGYGLDFVPDSDFFIVEMHYVFATKVGVVFEFWFSSRVFFPFIELSVPAAFWGASCHFY